MSTTEQCVCGGTREQPNDDCERCGFIQRIAELESENDKMRAFVEKVSKQQPEKPDYWSACWQCDRNIQDADEALEPIEDEQ